MKRRVTGLVVASVLLSGLGACSGGDPEPSSAPVPRVSATPTPTPTPTQTEPVDEIGVVVDLSDPKIGFELVDVPTDLEGDEADVYTTLALYSREYWRGMTMNEASPLLRTFTDSSLVANLERIAASNAADKAEIGGSFQVEVSNIVVEGDRATGRQLDCVMTTTTPRSRTRTGRTDLRRSDSPRQCARRWN